MQSKLVRSIAVQDIPRLAEIHTLTFKGFFLTYLGSGFIAKLYEAIIQDPTGIGCTAWNDGQVSGFVIGSTQPAGLYGRLLRKRWWQFGWAALPTFLRNPTIILRLLRAFSMPQQEQPAENCGMLMSIAVHPAYQTKGIGKLLVRAFLDEARSRGVQSVNLLTDAENNDATNHFYQNLGFVKVRTYATPEKRMMNEYLIRL